MRLFLGTHIKSDIIYSFERLHDLKEHWDCSMKFVEKENIHLTWKFIGEIEEKKLGKIMDFVRECSTVPLNIEIMFQKYAIWPDGRFPRQLVLLGKDTGGDGNKLYKSLNNKLADIGIKKEKRPFNPHITIARFKIKKKLPTALIFPDWLEFQETNVKFENLSLIESILGPKGSTYKIIESQRLGSKI